MQMRNVGLHQRVLFFKVGKLGLQLLHCRDGKAAQLSQTVHHLAEPVAAQAQRTR